MPLAQADSMIINRTLLIFLSLWSLSAAPAQGVMGRLFGLCAGMLKIGVSSSATKSDPASSANQAQGQSLTPDLSRVVSRDFVRQQIGSLNMYRVIDRDEVFKFASEVKKQMIFRPAFNAESTRPFSEEHDQHVRKILNAYVDTAAKVIAGGGEKRGEELIAEIQVQWKALTQDLISKRDLKSENSERVTYYFSQLFRPLNQLQGEFDDPGQLAFDSPYSMQSLTTVDLLLAHRVYNLTADSRNYIGQANKEERIHWSVFVREGVRPFFIRPEVTIFDVWHLGGSDFNYGLRVRWKEHASVLGESMMDNVMASLRNYPLRRPEYVAKEIHAQLVNEINQQLPRESLETERARASILFKIGFDERLLQPWENLVPYYQNQFLQIAQKILDYNP